MDPRFKYFYDLVRLVNYFQAEQPTPPIYILENTYPGEKCTPAVIKASDLVQAFIGAPVLIDAAELGAAAHRVRLFWTNMLQPAQLQATLPTMTEGEWSTGRGPSLQHCVQHLGGARRRGEGDAPGI